ncbi:MAG: hypothetical protein LH618_04235 [Saprospiraceae bacterium]|nr:hypothetical protein [Saprospiraceae bacterium]
MGQIESRHIPIFHTLETIERINKHIAFYQNFEQPDKMAVEQWQRIRADLQRQLGEMLAALDALPIIPKKSFTTPTPKRRDMSPERMAKLQEARLAKRTPAAATLKPEAERQSADIAPKRRGMSPEQLAKLREARLARTAAAKPITHEPPKMRGQNPEHMTRMREARRATRTAGAATEPTAEEKTPLRGMNAEHLAKIQEARLAKGADAALKKPIAEEAPKQKRGMSPEHLAKIREARAKRAEAAAKSKI